MIDDAFGTPSFVPGAEQGAPITFRWDPDIGLSLMRPRPDEHVRLAKAFRPLNERAAFAVLLAIAEWVVGRLRGLADLDDSVARLQAGYAALIDPRYAELPEPEGEYPEPDVINGPLDAVAQLIAEGFAAYADSEPEVKQSAFCMALVARHVAVDQLAFERWLSETLRHLSKRFPDLGQPLADQPRLLRQQLDLGASALTEANEIDLFLRALDPSQNRYLTKPQQLKDSGFIGMPYRFD